MWKLQASLTTHKMVHTFEGQVESRSNLYLHFLCLHVIFSNISSTCFSLFGVLQEPLVCELQLELS